MSLIEFKRAIRREFSKRRVNDRNSVELKEGFAREIHKEIKRARLGLSAEDMEQLCFQLLDDIFGFGPLQSMLDDPKISEVMINGPKHIFVEVSGVLKEAPIVFDDEIHLMEIIQRLVRRASQRLDETNPMVNCVIDHVYRMHAVISPVALNGPLVTIRKPQVDIQDMEDLLQRGTLNMEMYQFLWACVQSRINILFSGGTGSGKTTMMEVLSKFISQQERIVLIEDVPEIKLSQKNVARLCTRPPNLEGKGEIPLRTLFLNSLRMRPTRILLGEIRGSEAFEYLQSLNSGHEGSLAITHASSPEEAGLRLENLAQLAGLNIPSDVLRQQIAKGLDLVVQIDRYPDGSRKVSQISEVIGLDPTRNLLVEDLFVYEFEGLEAGTQRCIGNHKATGFMPTFYDEFLRHGVQVDPGIFDVK